MTERLYHVANDRQFRNVFHGGPRWNLGGIRCSVCGEIWCALGLTYPSVSLAGHVLEPEFRSRPTPPSFDEDAFAVRCRAIADRFPPSAQLLPCADVGPLDGRAGGQFGDFTWPIFYQLLVKRSAADRLRQRDVRIPIMVPVNLRYIGSGEPDLVELDLAPVARWSQQAVPLGTVQICQRCGWARFSRPAIVRVAASSIPEHVDLFRGAFDGNGIGLRIFATERFVTATEQLGLTGASYSEVAVE